MAQNCPHCQELLNSIYAEDGLKIKTVELVTSHIDHRTGTVSEIQPNHRVNTDERNSKASF